MAQGPDNAIYGEIVLYDGEEGTSTADGPRLIRVDGNPNVPGLVRLQGTLALDFGTPGGQLWKSNGDGTWTALSGGGATDQFVKVDAADTTSGFLSVKLVTNTSGVAFTVVGAGSKTYELSIATATELVQGLLELATQAEANNGLDDAKAITSLKLAQRVLSGGQLGGTIAVPDVRGIRETSGPTLLSFGAIADGQFLQRSGGSIIGSVAPGGIDIFVATNTWYIDATAAPDPARRIFPTIAAAITDANSALPPSDTVVLRLRENQVHVWDLSTGQDGTRPIVVFSHAETASAAPLLTLSNTLGGAIGPLWLYLTNLRLAGSAVIAGPWNLLIRKSRFVGGFTLTLDRTSGNSDALIQESDALLVDSAGNHPIFVSFTGPNFPNSGTVTFQRSRIEYGDSNNPTLPGAEVNGVVYDHCVIRIASQSPAFDASIGPVWVTPSGTLGEAKFIHTMIEVELRGFSTNQLFNEADPFSLTVVWDNVWVNAVNADTEGGPSVFSFGPRFDAGSFGGPPNRVYMTRGNLNSSVGFPSEITLPLDPPDGAIAVDPGFTANRETSWRAVSVDKGFEPRENVWIAADGTTHWIGTTTDGAPAISLTRTNSGLLDYQPLDQNFGIPGFRLQALVSAANQVGGGPVAVLQIDAVLEIGFGGPPVIVTQATTPLLDTSSGQFTAAVALDLANNGFRINVSQGTDPSAFVDWHADVKLQAIAASP